MTTAPTVIMRPFSLDVLTEYSEILTRLEKLRAEHCEAPAIQTIAERDALGEREVEILLEMHDYRRKVETFLFQALRWCAADQSKSLRVLLLDVLGMKEHEDETRKLKVCVENLMETVIDLRDELEQVKNGQARRTQQAAQATSEVKDRSVLIAGVGAF